MQVQSPLFTSLPGFTASPMPAGFPAAPDMPNDNFSLTSEPDLAEFEIFPNDNTQNTSEFLPSLDEVAPISLSQFAPPSETPISQDLLKQIFSSTQSETEMFHQIVPIALSQLAHLPEAQIQTKQLLPPQQSQPQSQLTPVSFPQPAQLQNTPILQPPLHEAPPPARSLMQQLLARFPKLKEAPKNEAPKKETPLKKPTLAKQTTSSSSSSSSLQPAPDSNFTYESSSSSSSSSSSLTTSQQGVFATSISSVGTQYVQERLLELYTQYKCLDIHLLHKNSHKQLTQFVPTIRALDLSQMPLSSKVKIFQDKRYNNDLSSLLDFFRHIESLTINASNLQNTDLAMLSHFPKLKFLRLINALQITPEGINGLIGMQNLQELRLEGTTAFSTQDRDTFSLHFPARNNLSQLMDSLPSIEQIFINSNPFQTIKPTDEYIQQLLSNPQVTRKEFIFRPCHLLTDKTLQLIAEKLPNLEVLILQGCFQFTEIGLQVIAALPNLNVLHMKGAVKIPEEVRKKILEAKPGLTAEF